MTDPLRKLQETIDGGYMALIGFDGREMSKRVRTTELQLEAFEGGTCTVVAFFEEETSPEAFMTKTLNSAMLPHEVVRFDSPLKFELTND